MKQCPACKRTYADDALLFCLEDGTQLQPAAAGGGPPSYDPNVTLAFNTARDTSPPPAGAVPQAPLATRPPSPPAWGPPPQQAYAPAARTGGRGWIVAAIAGVIALGIGIVVLLAIVGRDDPSANKGTSSNAANGAPTPSTPNANRSPSTQPSNVLKDDFSAENWPTGEGAYGSFYRDEQYHMKGKPDLYVYMFPVDYHGYASSGATVKVTARSVDGKSPDYGYGLIMHGRTNASSKLEGYGFLVYTGQTPMYEVVRFVDGKGEEIVKWTGSAAIRTGSTPNQLEVRAQGSQLSFYVNGQFLRSVTDTAGMSGGHVGLYTTGTNEVAFDDMEISRQ